MSSTLLEPEVATSSVPFDQPHFAHWRQPFQIGNVELRHRFTLAPLAGYTNLPLRLTLRELGELSLATTDLVNPRAITMGSVKTMELLATCPEDRPLSIQIYGSDPTDLSNGAKWLQDYGATTVDINMGCPVKKVVRGGGGSAMMCDTSGTTIKLVESVVKSVSIPITVKMRLGWDATNLSAPMFARQFEEVGVGAITIHGRTRAQGFTGKVNLDGIRQVVEAVKTIPILGNGDVRSVEDVDRMVRETGCHAIAIGRGALANPWIFKQFNHWLRTGDPGPRGSYDERLTFMETHLRRLIEWKGERHGCFVFRKICTWYCKALRTGKIVQQKLIQLSNWQEFQEVLKPLRDQGPPRGWTEYDTFEANYHVPEGPISHW
jgi:tRNA-dihydrouridine synthase B